jgi:putative N6-adenine-specific DNA methylase
MRRSPGQTGRERGRAAPAPRSAVAPAAVAPTGGDEDGAGILDIFLAATPGLEPLLAEEARSLGFADPRSEPGGVAIRGGWPEVWRANLQLRGAGRVLVRLAAFRALHLAQLDKRARRLPWASVLRADTPVRVDATCQGSRIWHDRAAAERIARAIAEGAGAPLAEDAPVRVLARIVDDLCTISLDASGEPLHRRGAKQAVGKAPLRETLAALFLRACGYDGTETVLDPMCGSGTFAIEAAEIAQGLAPGRLRDFAFERLAGFDAAAWTAMRAAPAAAPGPDARFFGFDRDAGAVEAACANADRAGVAAVAAFARQTVSAFAPPPELGGATGLVMVNPPYGERIGDKDDLRALYGTLGRVLRERFKGWRVGLVTSEPALAAATGLPFAEVGPPVPHGKLRIRLHRTDVLR